jgi:hypothetical protein
MAEPMTDDDDHLRLLSIFHYVVGGLIALFGCFPIIHVTVGLFLIFSPDTMKDNKGELPSALFGLLFVLAGVTIIAMFWTFAGCLIVSGHFLSQRKHYLFCLVMAAIACMCSPFGTVLGVFTIIVLMRESVKQAFTAGKLAGSSATGGAVV